MMRVSMMVVALVLGSACCVRAEEPTPAADSAPPRSPVNQVFQWAFTGSCGEWPDGSQSTATGYLWIPEDCERLRGLLILGTNVPEHMLVGHPAIRSACVDKSLGIVWCVPTFWNFGKFPEQTAAAEKAGPEAKAALQLNLRDIHARFLQTVLDGLAGVSGYGEVAAVPWLPMGESGHLLMVTGLVDARPDRCIAAICIKNPQGPQDRTVPMLWTFGTAQEWGQSQSDIRTASQNVTGLYEGWSRGRAGSRWPLSIAIEPGTGHFHCTDAMAELFSQYIRAAADARLAADGSNTLEPVNLDAGLLAELPVPGHEAAAGEPLPTDRAPPAIEWICGPIVPLGDGRFQVAPDRTYPFTTSYIAAVLNRDKGLRRSLQPARVKLRENREGVSQTITFQALPDVAEGIHDLRLSATSTAGLPVRFYVESGPAVVEGDKLVFTRIPPRAAFPVQVTVAAWQWGRRSEPQVQTAKIVRQSFTIVKAAGSP